MNIKRNDFILLPAMLDGYQVVILDSDVNLNLRADLLQSLGGYKSLSGDICFKLPKPIYAETLEGLTTNKMESEYQKFLDYSLNELVIKINLFKILG